MCASLPGDVNAVCFRNAWCPLLGEVMPQRFRYNSQPYRSGPCLNTRKLYSELQKGTWDTDEWCLHSRTFYLKGQTKSSLTLVLRNGSSCAAAAAPTRRLQYYCCCFCCHTSSTSILVLPVQQGLAVSEVLLAKDRSQSSQNEFLNPDQCAQGTWKLRARRARNGHPTLTKPPSLSC